MPSTVKIKSLPHSLLSKNRNTYQLKGPVRGLVPDVEYLDIRLKKGSALSPQSKKGYTSFCHLIKGTGEFDDTKLEEANLTLFTEPGSIAIKGTSDIHYILLPASSSMNLLPGAAQSS
jgi:redox-sensitive bicupin YhaK (pirin superfamily)